MLKRLMLVLVFMLSVSPAFAQYGYHYNKYGTGYYRDDSNDGNKSNNANALGMNNRGCGGATTQILGKDC